jgi:hypothetical protein
MWRFCWSLLLRTPVLLWESAKLWVELAGVFYLGVGIFGVSTLTLPPLWTLVPVATLFLYGFMRAVYERVSTAEEDNERLSKRLATDEKRRAVKELLGVAIAQGTYLNKWLYQETDEGKKVTMKDVRDWVHRTRDLIEAAFDKGEARHFLNGDGYKREGVQPFHNLLASKDDYFIPARVWRLNELIIRANELPINPDFDPQDWMGSFA